MGSQLPRVSRILGLGFICLYCLLGQLSTAQEVKTYESKYYTVTSDFSPVEMKEVLLRLDCMLLEYNQTFPALRGAITRKYNVQLFHDEAAFYAAGAPKLGIHSGYHNAKHQVFVHDENFTQALYELQYHCFQQFTNESIANDQRTMPVWLEIGLSQYFKFGHFTGDGFICGMITQQKIPETQQIISRGLYMPTSTLMALTPQDAANGIKTYECFHAWWIVHYLDVGEGGKHHAAFSQYLHDVARGILHKEAWRKAFGEMDIDAKWKAWMMAQKPEGSQEGYARAAAQALVSCLGRASIAQRRFTKMADLLAAIERNDIPMADGDFLPPSQFASIAKWIRLAGETTRFEIGTDAKKQQIIARLSDGTRVVSTFDPAQKERKTSTEVDGPGHVKRTPATNKTDEAGAATIVLNSAKFGAGDSWVDVTEKCRPMIVGDMMLAPRGLAEIFGVDPGKGQVNWLELQLTVNGARVRFTMADNQRLAPFRVTTHLPAEVGE